MEHNEYLNEERYQKSNGKVKGVSRLLLILGAVAIVLGIVLIILGATGIGNTIVGGMGASGTENMQQMAGSAFGKVGLFALGGFLSVIGVSLLSAGGIVALLAHRREITAYATQQSMPITQEYIEKMAPTLGSAVETLARGVKEGLSDDEEQ